jgi:hypothetical protein
MLVQQVQEQVQVPRQEQQQVLELTTMPPRGQGQVEPMQAL